MWELAKSLPITHKALGSILSTTNPGVVEQACTPSERQEDHVDTGGGGLRLTLAT